MKSVTELGPFEEWGLSEDLVRFLNQVDAVPEKILGYLRYLRSIKGASYDAIVHCFAQSGSSYCCNSDVGMGSPYWEILGDEVTSALEDYLWDDRFISFCDWLKKTSWGYFEPTKERWYPGVRFDHERYEGINLNVEEKIAKILEMAKEELDSLQYEMFEFALKHWETYGLNAYFEISTNGTFGYACSSERYQALKAAIWNMCGSKEKGRKLRSIVYH